MNSKIPTMWIMVFALLHMLLTPSDAFTSHSSVARIPATSCSTSAAIQSPMAVQMAGKGGEEEDINPEPLIKPRPNTRERPEPNLGVSIALAAAGVGKLAYDVSIGDNSFGTLAIDVLFALVMVAGFVKTFKEQQ